MSVTHFVIYVCDVHAVEDVVFEVVLQDPSQDVKGNVGPEQSDESGAVITAEYKLMKTVTC